MLGISLLVLALAMGGNLGWLDGGILLLGLIGYTVIAFVVIAIRSARSRKGK